MNIHLSRGLAGPGVALALVGTPGGMPAAQLDVTSLADNGPGSLRDVVSQAGLNDVIRFTVKGTISLTSGPIVWSTYLIVQGPGPSNLVISGNNQSRIFELSSGSVISDLTLANGRHAPASDGPAVPACGGAIYSTGSGGLTLSNCVVRDCSAVGSAGRNGTATGPLDGLPGGDASGGAVWCEGTNVFLHCTFARNRAEAGKGGQGFTSALSTVAGRGANGGSAQGGAVSARGSIFLLVCTLSGNTAQGGAGGDGGHFGTSGCGKDGGNGGDSSGGALFSDFLVEVRSCTVCSNTAPRSAGGIRGGSLMTPWCSGIDGTPGGSRGGGAAAHSLTMHNSILAGNQAQLSPECFTTTTITSAGHNLVLDPSGACCLSSPPDLLGPLGPLLGPLADNGGPTPTHALLTGSPAIDQGETSKDYSGLPYLCDQRFFPRPRKTADVSVPDEIHFDRADIGAYEYQPPIRLRADPGPTGPLSICWQAEANEAYELVCSPDVSTPTQFWTTVVKVLGLGGQWCEPVSTTPPPKFFLVRAAKR